MTVGRTSQYSSRPSEALIDSRAYLNAGTGSWFGNVGGGVFRSVQRTTTVEESLESLPAATALMQNWPNPFNPATQINYTVGQRQDYGTIPKGPLFGVGRGEGGRNVLVQLVVYDVLGRAVKTLVKESQRPGHYQVQFDGSGLASGLYFYRLQAEGVTLTKRMMLLR